MESNGRRQGVVSHPLVWFAAMVVPILVFIFTQLDFVQNADGWFLRGVTSWDLGKKDIAADIFAPVWVVSIIMVAALSRRLLDRYSDDPDPCDDRRVRDSHNVLDEGVGAFR